MIGGKRFTDEGAVEEFAKSDVLYIIFIFVSNRKGSGNVPGIFPDPFRLETKMKIIYKTSDLTNSSTAPASMKRLPPTIEVKYLNPIKINLYFFF